MYSAVYVQSLCSVYEVYVQSVHIPKCICVIYGWTEASISCMFCSFCIYLTESLMKTWWNCWTGRLTDMFQGGAGREEARHVSDWTGWFIRKAGRTASLSYMTHKKLMLILKPSAFQPEQKSGSSNVASFLFTAFANQICVELQTKLY